MEAAETRESDHCSAGQCSLYRSARAMPSHFRSDGCWTAPAHSHSRPPTRPKSRLTLIGLGIEDIPSGFKKVGSQFSVVSGFVMFKKSGPRTTAVRPFLHRLHSFFFRLPFQDLLGTGRRWNCAAAMSSGGKRSKQADFGTVPAACTWASSWCSAGVSFTAGPCFDVF